MRVRTGAVSHGLLVGVLSSLAFGAAGAQSLPPLPKTAERTPLVLRADGPHEGSLTDGSLIPDFGATVDGVNADAIARLSVFVTPTSGFSCTGSLIGPHTILTAAHCVTDDLTGELVTEGNKVRARFIGPNDTPVDVWSRQILVQPGWLGFFNPDTDGGQDVALIDLDGNVPNWLAPYSLFGGDPLFQNTDFVGYGEFGTGNLGALGFDAKRRWGQNRVDFLSDPFFGDGSQILWTDFDNGHRLNDAFCWATGFGDGNPFCDRGRGVTEMGLGQGDSGGPLFIDGQVAGVASFSTVFCGDPNCDTVAAPPLAHADVFDGWGSLNGFASVEYNSAWIQSQLSWLDGPAAAAVATPEPSTVALTLGGLLAIAGFTRRRRTVD